MTTADKRLISGEDLQKMEAISYTRLNCILLPRAATVLKALFLKVWHFYKKRKQDTRPDNEIFFAAAGYELMKRFNEEEKKLVTLESVPLWTFRMTSLILQKFNFGVENLSNDDKVELKLLEEAKVEIESFETPRMKREDFERLWKSIADILIHFGDDPKFLGRLKITKINHLLQKATKVDDQAKFENKLNEIREFYDVKNYEDMVKKCTRYSSNPQLSESEISRLLYMRCYPYIKLACEDAKIAIEANPAFIDHRIRLANIDFLLLNRNNMTEMNMIETLQYYDHKKHLEEQRQLALEVEETRKKWRKNIDKLSTIKEDVENEVEETENDLLRHTNADKQESIGIVKEENKPKIKRPYRSKNGEISRSKDKRKNRRTQEEVQLENPRKLTSHQIENLSDGRNFLIIDPIFNTQNSRYDRKKFDTRELIKEAENGNEQAKSMLTAISQFEDCITLYVTDLERNIDSFILHLSESIRTCRLIQNFTTFEVECISRTVHNVYDMASLNIDDYLFNRDILTCLIHLRYIPSEAIIELIGNSVKQFPDVLYFRLAYCDVLCRMKAYAKCFKETEFALKVFPKSIDLLYIRAKLLVNWDVDVKESLIALMRFIDSAPSNDYRVPEVFYTTALILYNQNGEDTDEKLNVIVNTYCCGLKAETEILKIFLPYKSYAKDQMTPILEKAPYNELFVTANKEILDKELEIGL